MKTHMIEALAAQTPATFMADPINLFALTTLGAIALVAVICKAA